VNRLSRRHVVQGAGAVGLGLLAGCGRWPGPTQAPKVHRVGLFHVGTDHVPPSLQPLRNEITALGYQEGSTIHLDWRNLEHEDAAYTTAQDFVRDRVSVIVAFENLPVRAAQAATSEIPVVFLHVHDPVGSGFVASYARPGGNITGFVNSEITLGKQLEFFRQVVPGLRRVLFLVDPEDPGAERELAEARAGASPLQLELIERQARNGVDIARVFAAFTRDDVDGVFIGSGNLRTGHRSLLIRSALDRQLPLAAGQNLGWVQEGALFAYGPDFAAIGVPAARYVDRILKGDKPADLPVQQGSVFAFVINLRTAQALGLTIPQHVLLQATEVIQ
jgi:putative tryptophan/tyrosine transport system substrate-binding protein